MFELTIMMKIPSPYSERICEEEHKYYFDESEMEEMFDLITSTIKAAKHEIEYAIRVIEEGQINEG